MKVKKKNHLNFLITAKQDRIIRSIATHYLNPLHIFCYLQWVGLARKKAMSLAKFYDWLIFQRVKRNIMK